MEIYRGKAKSVCEGEGNTYVMEFRDDLTAGDGAKKESKAGKGALNAEISAKFFEVLAAAGIKTHFIRFEPPSTHIVKRVKIVPLEVICRNIATGSILKRYPFEEGRKFDPPLLEMGYKDDAYHDPFLNDAVALALGAAKDVAELQEMRDITIEVNDILSGFLKARRITLVDFKLEFGRDSEGNLLLADEVSPDTCRFWDADTGEIMDKDRFRQDLGDVLGYYEEVRRRIVG
ncbi:MAG: phosphoribosylaminoimidazolesuccinocarboxamide synthase [Candidatus Hydrothermarchaeaceae archaeon]